MNKPLTVSARAFDPDPLTFFLQINDQSADKIWFPQEQIKMMTYYKRHISSNSSLMNESNNMRVLPMKALTANEAKTHFGEMLLNAQRGPVQINKNGKPVAVLVSFAEYENIEALKLNMLQSRVSRARDDIVNQDTVDGESFFAELELGMYV